jgi:hypothetical protein
VVIVAAGWYLGSPLFIDDTVEEAFPFEAPQESEVAAMSVEERISLEAELLAAVPDEATVAELPEQDQASVAERVEAAAELVMMDKALDDEMMEMEGWTAVLNGQFSGADNFHMGEGRAAVFVQGEQRVLRFEDFSVTNGPDLHVILSKNPAPTGQEGIGEDYLDLGALKGNLGNQNYEIPADVDLSEYHSVIIYCVPFHVVFATAALG